MPVYRILIVEDEFLSRTMLVNFVEKYARIDVAANGQEAVDAVRLAYEAGMPYDLVLLDIVMPVKDGQTALREIRAYEDSRGILASQGGKIVMITALGDAKNVMGAFAGQCEGYITKPYSRGMIEKELAKLGLAEK